MGASLVEYQQQDVDELLLRPLASGRPVALRVTDRRLPKKKRVDTPLLFITPLSLYGGSTDTLVFSLQAYGCEVVPIRLLKPSRLRPLGLAPTLTSSLCAAVLKVVRSGKRPI